MYVTRLLHDTHKMINFRLSGCGFINVGLPPASPSETEQDVVRWMAGWMDV